MAPAPEEISVTVRCNNDRKKQSSNLSWGEDEDTGILKPTTATDCPTVATRSTTASISVSSNASTASNGSSSDNTAEDDEDVDVAPAVNKTSSITTLKTNQLKEKLSQIPTRGYVSTPTPVEYLPRLTKACGKEAPQLYIKRDDLLPLAGGGSKTRKLDFLVDEAIRLGCDTLVTSGAVQSNHCRLTASAAAREGLGCYLILEERIKGSYNPQAGGNNYAFALLGAKQVSAPLGGVAAVQDELVAKLKAEGKKPYVIVGGGSNELGALGYVKAALELIDQSNELKKKSGESSGGLYWDAIVTCSGSGGTHTGLLAGLRAAGYTNVPVIGISVRFDSQTQAERIRQQTNACIQKNFSEFFDSSEIAPEDVIVVDEHVGDGYSLPTNDMAHAIQDFAQLESILLDPVYTGKGAAGFLNIAKTNPQNYKNMLFVHTGGAPSLFHYQTLPY